MEYMQGGSVADIIHKGMEQLDMKTVLKWATNAAKGVQFLHEHRPEPIIHCDLKSDNLLVDENGLVKVGDFGTAKLLQNITDKKFKPTRKRGSKRVADNDYATTFVGTLCWAAPEVLPPKPPKKAHKHTKAADVFSYGVTLWEMVSNRRPLVCYQQKGYKWDHQVMDAVINGERPYIASSTPPPIKDLIELCWHADRDKRPTFEKVNDILANFSRRIEIEELVMTPDSKKPKTFPPSGASTSMSSNLNTFC
eukprot:gene16068-17691_t